MGRKEAMQGHPRLDAVVAKLRKGRIGRRVCRLSAGANSAAVMLLRDGGARWWPRLCRLRLRLRLRFGARTEGQSRTSDLLLQVGKACFGLAQPDVVCRVNIEQSRHDQLIRRAGFKVFHSQRAQSSSDDWARRKVQRYRHPPVGMRLSVGADK